MSLITVTQAVYQEDYKIFLQFNNGLSGVVDLEKYLDGEVFQPLKHKEFFLKFQVDAWTVYWENGSDFAPEFLCDLLLRQTVTD